MTIKHIINFILKIMGFYSFMGVIPEREKEERETERETETDREREGEVLS